MYDASGMVTELGSSTIGFYSMYAVLCILILYWSCDGRTAGIAAVIGREHPTTAECVLLYQGKVWQIRNN